ncbi:MAG: protein kinase [Pyrinomonadaceae bacterium]|nr:protein kinase [Pyrinomonadaceae bacterium]
MSTLVGKRFGRYELRSLLGVGGMGEVFLAHDSQLRRPVALKLLPPKFTLDEERLRRFKQEAFAASALNHPNILTIHEIGSQGDTHFIVTEFIDGVSLREFMAKEPLPLGQVLDICSQIASALAAAHRAGIVHRDVKPENVMLRRDGYVKVLDFGLAKLTEAQGLHSDSEAATVQVVSTDPGKVMGTARYMSPEQARGLEVNEQTDIWSLGVLLYELSAGRLPFEGQTGSDILASILTTEPLPLQRHSPDLPSELQRIVRKALRKDREERYQLAKELALDLKNLRRELELSAEMEFAQQPSPQLLQASGLGTKRPTNSLSSSRTAELYGGKSNSTAEYLVGEIKSHPKVLASVLGVIGLAALAIVLAVAYRWNATQISSSNLASSSRTMKIARLTSTGTADEAAISPDGKYLVHVASESGRQSLRVRQVNTNSDVEIVPPSDVQYAGLSFSRDGDFIYYVAAERNNSTSNLYQIPVLGGNERRLISNVGSAVTFSPDGQQLAFIRNFPDAGEDALMIASAHGDGERKLAVRKLPNFFRFVSWSPDGKTIACSAGSFVPVYTTYIIEVALESGREKQIGTQSWLVMGQLAWIGDGNGLIVVASEQESGSFNAQQIWYVSYPQGEARHVTNDLNNYTGVSLTTDSNRMVTVQSETSSNIWIVPNGDANLATRTTTGAGKIDGHGGLASTPEGKIIYASKASGNLDLWIMAADGINQKQLTENSRINNHPAVSPDGRFIIFASNRAGASNIWRTDIDGGNARQLTRGSGEDHPQCSPDGKWVVYTLLGAGKPTLWRVSIDGGAPQQLTEKYTTTGVFSPEGRSVASLYREEQSNSPLKLAIFPLEGGQPTRIFESPILRGEVSLVPPRWTRDARALTYVGKSAGVSNIWLQAINGGEPRQLTTFKAERIFSFDWSRDGKQLLVARGMVASDVVLISNFR